MSKVSVKIGGVPIAAVGSAIWQITRGATPYRSVFEVHKSQWSQLRNQLGKDLTLEIQQGGKTRRFRKVSILHQVPTTSKNRVGFIVSDLRWKWRYKLVTRDYNIPRRTGNKSTSVTELPIQVETTIDEFDFFRYTLNDGKKWTGREIIEDILEDLEEGNWEVREFPLTEGGSVMSTVGVTLRDAGDAALSRALNLIPGADIFVSEDGKVIVYDSIDDSALGQKVERLEDSWTKVGDYPIKIDRKAVRPKRVIVHYQREVEVFLQCWDDMSDTANYPSKLTPYAINVLQTVDESTNVTITDPYTLNATQTALPAGCFVWANELFNAWETSSFPGVIPITWEVVRRNYAFGSLEDICSPGGAEYLEAQSTHARIGSIRQHFRNTWRISQPLMQNCRRIVNARVNLLDPITGTRVPSMVWSQLCLIPNTQSMPWSRGEGAGDDPEKQLLFKNVDWLGAQFAPDVWGVGRWPTERTIQSSYPAPMTVQIMDEQLGLFSTHFIDRKAGWLKKTIPGFLVSEYGDGKTWNSDPRSSDKTGPIRDLSKQDDAKAIIMVDGPTESGADGLCLDNSMGQFVVMTFYPAVPNNNTQFHRVAVNPEDIDEAYRAEYGITGGDGPDLNVFVAASEMTARFAWRDDQDCLNSFPDIFDLRDEPRPPKDGEEEELNPEFKGFVLVNDGGGSDTGGNSGGRNILEGRHLQAHALAVAAEQFRSFADTWTGNVTLPMPREAMELYGNMSSNAIQVGSAPSGRVVNIMNCPPQPRPISRYSMLDDSTRKQILGQRPYG